MHKIILPIIIAIFSFIIPADAAQIENLIPQNCYVYANLYDLDEVWEAVTASENWAAILGKERLKQLEEMRNMSMMIKFMLGADIKAIVDTFGHHIAFIITQLEQPRSRYALIVDVGGYIGEAEDIIAKLDAILALNNQAKEVQHHAGEYLNIPFGTFRFDQNVIKHGFIDDLFVLGLNDGAFEAIVDTYRKKKPALAKDASFKNIQKKFKNDQIFVYVNEPAFAKINTNTSAKNLQRYEAIGIDSISALGFGIDLFVVDGLQRIYVQIEDKEPRGMINLISNKRSQKTKFIHTVGKSGDVSAAMSLGNLDELWDSLRPILMSEWQTNEQGDSLWDTIHKLENASGLNFEDDILNAFTGEIGFSAGMPMSDMNLALIIEVKDFQKCQSLIDGISKLMDSSPEEVRDDNGATIYKLSPNQPSNATITYGLVKNVLVVGFAPKTVQQTIEDVASRKEAKTVSKFLKRLPESPVFLLHLNLDSYLTGIASELKINLNDDAKSHLENLGSFGCAISPAKDGLWLCTSVITAENLLETLGRVISLINPLRRTLAD